MSPDLQRLIKLQQLESTLADARATIAAHPQRLADADARLNESKQAVEAAKGRLKDNQEARRNLEKDVAVYQGRLTKFKDQLSLVKTNKEYQAMQHEIATAQSDLGGVEEKVLELMLEADTITADVKRTEAALTTRQKEIDKVKKELTEELASVETSLKEASEARTELVKDLDVRLMAIFEQVARVRKGVAISTATRDGLCAACHVRLRPFVFQQIRQNDAIIQCESCHRILYWIPPPPPIEHAVVHT
jgi:predicted  nucleic acid-binding Zn-ribbon protein